MEPLSEWVERMQKEAPLCDCGCGKQIIVKKAHRHHGIPRFIHGHRVRVGNSRSKKIDRWVEQNQGINFCVCGCGRPIELRRQHHCSSTGIPQYRLNHGPRPYLGYGSSHPCYVSDRNNVKSRQGQYFTPWTMKMIRDRDGGRCVQCGSTSDLEYDHIVPISQGGTADPDNGQLLCHECHRVKTRIEQAENRQIKSILEGLQRVLELLEQMLSKENQHDHCRKSA